MQSETTKTPQSADEPEVPQLWHTPKDILSRPTIRTGLTPVSLGISAIDDFLEGGLNPGSVTTMFARTGGAKSQMAANISRASAQKGHIPLHVTLEDSEDEVVLRMLSQSSEVFLNKLRRGVDNLTNEIDRRAVFRGSGITSKLGVRIVSNRDLNDLCLIIEKHRETGGDLVIIDYFGCINLDPKTTGAQVAFNEYQRASHIMRSLEQLAKELTIPILVFCQANRQGLMSWEPLELWHIRDSGFIEQLSSVVMSIERGRQEPGVQPLPFHRLGPRLTLPIRVLKNRWGPTHRPVDDGIESGRDRTKKLRQIMLSLNYDCIRLDWSPSVHLIGLPPLFGPASTKSPGDPEYTLPEYKEIFQAFDISIAGISK